MAENWRLDALCSRQLRVLAEPTRLSVLRLLLERPRQVGEMVQALGLKQNLLSHHLKVLRDAGLTQGEREGKAMRYRVTDAVRGSKVSPTIDLGCCELRFPQRAIPLEKTPS